MESYVKIIMQTLIECTHVLLFIFHGGNRKTDKRKELPWWEVIFLEYVEVKKGGRQAHSDVHGCHLVLLHGGCDIAEETEQCLQHLPIFIWHQHDGCLDGLQPLVLRHICTLERIDLYYFCFTDTVIEERKAIIRFQRSFEIVIYVFYVRLTMFSKLKRN